MPVNIDIIDKNNYIIKPINSSDKIDFWGLLINGDNYKIIGIQKYENNFWNKGIFFNKIIEDINRISKNDEEKEISIMYRAKINTKIDLFGKNFIENNKNNCQIIINGKKRNLSYNFDAKEIDILNNNYKIKLTGINKITNLNGMFSDCKYLPSISNIEKLSKNKLTDISCMFYGSKPFLDIQSISGISKFNTSKVKNMSNLFNGCESFSSLPDISN